MNKWIMTCYCLSMGLAANAQTINVRGKISDGTGKAIAGATVLVVKLASQTTSGADGSFSITKASSIFNPSAFPLDGQITLDNGALEFSVAYSAPVKIEFFDVKGNLVEKQGMDKASTGVYRLSLAGKFHTEKLIIVKATVGNQVRMFRYFPSLNASGLENSSFQNIGSGRVLLAKVAATVDTLKVSATGYLTSSVLLNGYDTTVNVTLETSGGNGTAWGGLKNPAVKTAGCGKAAGITNGKKTITSSGSQRTYIIDIPTKYNMNKAYRLFYCSHWIGSTSEAVQSQDYYFLKPLANAANDSAIFIAPQSVGSTWQENDHQLFNDILEYAKANLCIDSTRVFATGFSFGGMITYSLSTVHQKQIRAAVGIAPANYNIWLPSPIPHDPIAWMQTTGVNDNTCPWINNGSTTQGSKFIAINRGTDNGCTIPATIPKWSTGAHLCVDFDGCKPEYPTKVCTFNGDHTNVNSDPNTNNVNWIPQESWKFFTQF